MLSTPPRGSEPPVAPGRWSLQAEAAAKRIPSRLPPAPLQEHVIAGASLRIWHEDEAATLFQWRNFVVVDARTSPRPEHMLLQEDMLHKMREEHPNGAAKIVFGRSSAKLPGDAVTDAIRRWLERNAPYLKAYVMLPEHPGFQSALYRGAVSGLFMSMRDPIPMRVLGSSKEVSEWILPAMRDAADSVSPRALQLLLERIAEHRGPWRDA